MEGELERRIAANEVVLREVNEGIQRGQWPGEEGVAVGFRCECARLGCNKVIELTMAEYRGIREHPRRFVVAPGHAVPEAETVVNAEPRYLVIEKRERAGALAEATDPRG